MKEIIGKDLLKQLPQRATGAHKYDAGFVGIIGGNESMAGAPLLSAQGAFRSGAGLVRVFTHPSNVLDIVYKQHEIMVDGSENAQQIEEKLKKIDALAIGPGLGNDSWAFSMWEIFKGFNGPKVIDADALQFLKQGRVTNSIITPHEGEAKRLLGARNLNREQIATKLLDFSDIVVLKGPDTLVFSDKEKFVLKGSNNALATAGTGDILTGVICSLLAQGMSLFDSACLGVWLHFEASKMACKNGEGKRGMMASDLLLPLRKLVN